MKKIKLIPFIVIALLLFQCKKKEEVLAIPNYNQIIQDCLGNQLTDSLEIANNLIGTWDLVDHDCCDNCNCKFSPFITLKLNKTTGLVRIEEFSQELNFNFDWFLSPGNPFLQNYFRISPSPLVWEIRITFFCEEYMVLDPFTEVEKFLYKKRN